MKKFLTAISLIFVGAASVFAAACTNKNTVKYSFDTDGGVEISQVSKNKGEEYELPIPVKDGFEFEGWFESENLTGEPVTSVAASEDRTFYAKWAQLYDINLVLDGGTLSQTALKLKEGANVYDFMSQYVPQKQGLEFGAWYNGDRELAKNVRMPASALTLTAKYKVGYKIEVYKQNVAGDGYEKSAEDITGSDYIGATVSPDITEKGFSLVSNSNQVLSKTLTATAADNVLKFYFDREEYTVSLRSYFPDGTTGANDTYTVKYGEKIQLRNDLTFEGYCLVGWSDKVDGEVKYAVNYIDTVLYGGTKEVEPVYFTVENDISLYASWLKGNVDMFATDGEGNSEGSGSRDYVYLIGEEIYLSRGNVFFKGSYDELTGEFSFRNDANKIIISGKLNGDGTFCYANDLRRDFTATLFSTGTGFNKSTSLHLDEYNGATVTVKNEQGINELSKGTYTILPSGEYVITFPELNSDQTKNGVYGGQKLNIRIGYANDANGNRTNAFSIRNDKEYEMASLVRFAVTDSGDLSFYANDILALKLDGYGNASMYNGSQNIELSYVMDLKADGTGEVQLYLSGQMITAKLLTEQGRLGYMLYDEDNLYDIKLEDVSVYMDGLYNAVYTVGNKTYSGSFTVAGSSILGGTVYNFYSTEKKCKIIIKVTTEGVGDAATKTYQVTEQPTGYSESYYYGGGNLTDSFPTVLALNDGASGAACLYQRTQAGAFKLIAKGTFERGSDGFYVFTKTEHFVIDEADIVPFDCAALKSFKFLVGTRAEGNGSYPVNFWVEKTENENDKVDFRTEYTSASGAKIEFVAGYAIFSKDGMVSVGAYATAQNGVTTIAASNPVYVRLNTADKTFVELVSAPSTAYENKPDGSTNQNFNLYFDGTENGVTYNYMDGDEAKSVSGTYARTGETKFGNYIYTFTAGDGTMTFKFIRMSTSQQQFFAKENTEYSGVYQGKGVLELDGFTFNASYTDTEGNKFEGIHMVAGENFIAMAIDGRVRYFDIEGGKTFVLRGEEYANYVVLDNGYSDGRIILIDGKGHAEIRKVDANEENGYAVIAKDAPYEIIGDTEYISVTYGDGKTMVGARRFVSTGSSTIPVFVIIHEEVEHTYVNPSDHSVFILDKIGGVIRYNAQGERERGGYTLITESMLYFSGSTEESAGTYIYDTVNKTITRIAGLSGFAYYTKDLEALNFTQYGFVVVNGASRYYYEIDADGEVTVYRPGEETDTVNEYGFIVDEFGKFTQTKTYLGKDYIANAGFGISFKRGEEGDGAKKYPIIMKYEDKKDQYGAVVYEPRLDKDGNPVLDKDGNPVKDPVQVPVKAALENLTFTPSGGSSFNNNGSVTIDGKQINCKVIREVKDGKTETYITVPLNVGVMRYDIEIEYKGATDDGTILNTYKILSCRSVDQYSSVRFLSGYLNAMMMDMFYGTNYAANLKDVFGTVTVGADYDENGDIIGERYILTEFGENMNIVDANGERFDFVKTPYTYSSNVYTTEVTLADGYLYRLRIGKAQVMQGLIGYQIIALTRVQTLEVDGYTVEVERIIATDSNSAPGNPYRITLKKGEEEIPFTSGIIDSDGAVYYISRTVVDKRITATVYYKLTFAEAPGGAENAVKPYVSVTVTKTEATATYDANGRMYADITADNKVLLVYYNGYSLLAKSSTYDAASGVYTVETYNGTFTVKIVDGYAVIEVVEESV